MRILADENMPYVEALFAEHAQITTKAGRAINADDLVDIDVLLVRSVTQVNRTLIAKANKLKYVGSATIGMDHVDQQALAERDIRFSNAPGCNAVGVGQWVAQVLLTLADKSDEVLKGKKLAVIGAGNTGTAAAKCLQALGCDVRLCDPFKAASGDPRDFVSLDEALDDADIVTCHVPLTKDGEYPTHYLLDRQRLESLKPNVWILNACRGAVIDNRALIDWAKANPQARIALDVWEGEPNPMPELADLVEIATPHIAGYSLEGKARGSYMLYQWLAPQLTWPAPNSLASLLPNPNQAPITCSAAPSQSQLLSWCERVYDLDLDDRLFRQKAFETGGFDGLRKNHQPRREFSALTLVPKGKFEVNWLEQFGFSVGR
ncbi:4-phosphoerythronate dehydrogenase [Paraferrimonas sedimenticola]|uniref:Erythronate-4-phosphate dehydrogenase n=1 Tax=Paraferrimonas sedimenticola TaxID=375674 RepID=A0AA37VXH9_9GAMM|nr:4-phosphoerythronate dehydrogenase [Paraferrimonas sedimenticola]GLP96579.1 erythronate-4-phosphate dehydrogenase [Paraferrimonas sedimenticola]